MVKVETACSVSLSAVNVYVSESPQLGPPAKVRVENCPFALTFTSSDHTISFSEFVIDRLT